MILGYILYMVDVLGSYIEKTLLHKLQTVSKNIDFMILELGPVYDINIMQNDLWLTNTHVYQLPFPCFYHSVVGMGENLGPTFHYFKVDICK